MKIAIHHTSGSFSERWIEYCKKNNIPYKIVNAYDNDIIKQVKDCDAFMWHHNHANYKDSLFAKQLLFSLQMAGKKVFPDFNTGWHFDDKVGQKYLLESIGAPLVPSYVFYSKKEALQWIEQTSFPKVFKLRGGAGASNVRLVRSRSQARSLVNKAFGRGFSQFNSLGYFKDRYKKFRAGKDSFIGVLKGLARLIIPTEYAKMHSREKGYVYFQDFIPDNETDFRINVVNGNCWGFQRSVRRNDFRASGSGNPIYDSTKIPLEMVRISQKIANILSLQSVAFDFVIDKKNKEFMIVEISYCYGFDGADKCGGYWDKELNWHPGTFISQYFMVESILNCVNRYE